MDIYKCFGKDELIIQTGYTYHQCRVLNKKPAEMVLFFIYLICVFFWAGGVGGGECASPMVSNFSILFRYQSLSKMSTETTNCRN